MAIVGIDLGTTNSLISFWNSREAVIIPNGLGDHLTPSVVGVDDNGEILVGRPARERLVVHPDKTVANFKRYMGTGRKLAMGKYKFRPEELSSFVLRALKADAEAYLGERVHEAVISVPAYFSDAQRKATRIAGQLAGLKVNRLINEPTAAAMAYGIHQGKDDAAILVFDLGGGTFDVSILEFYAGVMEVRATAGDNFLGGEDFLNILVKAFCQQNEISLEDIASSKRNLIYQKAEKAKCRLSKKNGDILQISLQGRAIEWSLTRQEFEQLCTPLIKRIRMPVERALLDAKVKSKELDAVVLVGGATRMPLIRSMVARMFGKFPSLNTNPDEAVALGAAIQAGLKRRDQALREIVLTDVCPYTLGIEVTRSLAQSGYSSGHFAPIMERGVVIPASKEERFYTLYDGQEAVEVVIYQGESRLVKDNIKLGKLTVPVPAGAAGQEAVDVRFTYNIDGILEVEVTVVSNGLKKNVVIEESPGVLSQEEIRQRLAALSELKIHPRDKVENRTLLAWGERLYESRLDKERRAIADAMMAFEAAIESQESKTIARARIALERLLKQIEHDEAVL